MKNYLLVRNGAGAASVPLPLNGTVREVRTAEEAIAAVENGELKRHISEADHNMYADKERKKIRR